MIETEIYNYITSKIPDSDITWGKLNAKTKFDGVPVINFFKLPSQTNNFMPVYLDNFQFTIRHEYIDSVTEYANKVLEAFQFLSGNIGDYQVWVVEVINNGTIYEEEDVVAANITVVVKYAGI